MVREVVLVSSLLLTALALVACTERNPAYIPEPTIRSDAEMPCEDECSQGALRCARGGVERCERRDASACLVWGEFIACEADEHCEEGECVEGVCEPSCEGKACGADDGCGAPCPTGGCPTNASCVGGKCECEGVSCGGACCAAGELCGAADVCVPPSDCEHQFVKGAVAVNDLVKQGWEPVSFAAHAGYPTFGVWLRGGREYRYTEDDVEATIGAVIQGGGSLEAFYVFDTNGAWEGALMEKASEYDFVYGENSVNGRVAQGWRPVSFAAHTGAPAYGAWLQGGAIYRYVDANVEVSIGPVVSSGGSLEAFYRFDRNGAWAGALMEKNGEYDFVFKETGVNGAVAQGWTPSIFLADAGYTTKAAWLEGGDTFRYVTSNVEAAISAVVASGGRLRAFFNFDGNGAWHGALMRRGCRP